MGPLPVLNSREVIAILERMGFEELRLRGSHKQVRHPDGRRTTVPVHGGRGIAPLLLRLIIRDAHVTPEEFLRHR
jgi:predicted RNA binding protein YcfA (HicA-like mRNA interferase family)